ncbi:MAG: polyprenyl synthetase family protein [Deltaproteobacteria bacterium]|jgi:geranylgeranyl pyrophosphate synthase|nr:MAG: polyprenyl synthetase family protein [Deltaproteobacteria bacterium]
MLTELLSSIDPHILESINEMELGIESENCNKEVNQLLQNTVLVGGKRLRPMLTQLMGAFFGRSVEEVVPFAKAIELVHAASLAHDDVIDNATERRGVPSINIAGSNKKAILAGDYLLADVIVTLTKTGHLELVKEMSFVIQDLAEGEWIQSDACESRHYTEEIIKKIAELKTASVMSWCCLAPAYLSGQSDNLVEYARSFGSHLGLAFQMMDDTLDFSGQSKKDQLLDLKNGVVNSVVYKWFTMRPDVFDKFKSGEDIMSLVGEENLDKAVEAIQKQAHWHLEQAKNVLGIMETELSNEIKNTSAHKNSIKPLNLIIDYMGGRKF